jgi:DNA-binding cell septation regulator SpoVG
MSASLFKVSLRLIESGSALLAKADVSGRVMTINGFSVMQGKDGKPNWVAEPSVKQGSGFVKIVEITCKSTRETINRLILEAYSKAVSERQAAPQNESDEGGF